MSWILSFFTAYLLSAAHASVYTVETRLVTARAAAFQVPLELAQKLSDGRDSLPWKEAYAVVFSSLSQTGSNLSDADIEIIYSALEREHVFDLTGSTFPFSETSLLKKIGHDEAVRAFLSSLNLRVSDAEPEVTIGRQFLFDFLMMSALAAVGRNSLGDLFADRARVRLLELAIETKQEPHPVLVNALVSAVNSSMRAQATPGQRASRGAMQSFLETLELTAESRQPSEEIMLALRQLEQESTQRQRAIWQRAGVLFTSVFALLGGLTLTDAPLVGACASAVVAGLSWRAATYLFTRDRTPICPAAANEVAAASTAVAQESCRALLSSSSLPARQ